MKFCGATSMSISTKSRESNSSFPLLLLNNTDPVAILSGHNEKVHNLPKTVLEMWCKLGITMDFPPLSPQTIPRLLMDGWMNQAYSRLSTIHGHITDCKFVVCMYWTRLVLVRPAASLYSASPLKHHPTDKQ